MEQFTHTFAVEMADPEERTISGLAAPYNETIVHNGRSVRFSAGMFGENALRGDVHLQYGHDGEMPIGRVIEAKETPAGLRIKARLTTTPKANDVYTMLKDGTLKNFSVGFVGRESQQDEDGTQIWTKVDLHEVSVVPRPAFQSAAITEVHSAADTTTEMETDEFTMSDEIVNEVGELKEAFSDLERKVALLHTADAAPAVSKFKSGGEVLKALAAGDEGAKQEFTYTGSTLATNVQPHPAWVNRQLLLVNGQRYVMPLFDQQDLPEFGTTVSYPYTSAHSGVVAEQVAEGDALGAIGLTVSTGTATVKTYAASSSLSRQAIERSDVAFLDATLRLQGLQYALATDSAVRSALTGATGTQAGTALTVDNASNWAKLIEEGRGLIWDNSNGLSADFLLVSRPVMTRLATMVDSVGRPLFDLNGDGEQSLGVTDLSGFGGYRGKIANFPVFVDPHLTGNTVYVCSKSALITYASPGAPFNITLPNVLNLTQDFSLWGYQAIAVPNPLGIVEVNATLV